MMDFIKKITGQKSESDCCGVEIKEVVDTEAKNDSCCGSSSEEKKDSCCG
ncbi:hypothetical protein V1499_04465 [Neobacillus sp. SCS-31]